VGIPLDHVVVVHQLFVPVVVVHQLFVPVVVVDVAHCPLVQEALQRGEETQPLVPLHNHV
jgi:hypothetical protein